MGGADTKSPTLVLIMAFAAGGAGCSPKAGGETTDFGGSSASCGLAPGEPVTPEVAQQYALDQVKEQAGGAFQAAFRWEPWVGAVPTEFAVDTTIDGTITFVGEAVYHEGVSYVPGAQCPGEVTEAVTLTLATGDESLVAADLPASLTVRTNEWLISAVVDPAMLAKHLDLNTDPLSFAVDIHGGEGFDAPRGVVAFRDAVPRAPRAAPGTPDGNTTIYGHWPIDDCSIFEFPIAGDTPNERLGDKTWNQVVAEAWSAVQSAQPFAARWLDGPQAEVTSYTEVSLEPGVPDRLCARAGGTTLRFTPSSRIRSSDGRVNTVLVTGLLSTQASPEPGSLLDLYLDSVFPPQLTGDLTFLPADQFAAVSGITGFDAAGSTELVGSVQATFKWEQDSLRAYGMVLVIGACTYPCASVSLASLSWDRSP
jgi:hypothetical protein